MTGWEAHFERLIWQWRAHLGSPVWDQSLPLPQWKGREVGDPRAGAASGPENAPPPVPSLACYFFPIILASAFCCLLLRDAENIRIEWERQVCKQLPKSKQYKGCETTTKWCGKIEQFQLEWFWNMVAPKMSLAAWFDLMKHKHWEDWQWVQILALSFINCGTLGRSFGFSEPHFLYL